MTRDMIYERLMRESNMIEGELEDGQTIGRLNPNDMDAIRWFMDLEEITEDHVFLLHVKLAEGRKLHDVGMYRKSNVMVGRKLMPSPSKVPEKMKDFWSKWPSMMSWDAHNAYEHIHPFEDLNGRTGRLLWLWKWVKERGRLPDLPFLHLYYYQTLGQTRYMEYSAFYTSHRSLF